MEIVTALILLCLIVKIIAVSNAIRWLVARGRRFKKYLCSHTPRSVEAHYRAIERCGAAFFPFGVKDYIAHKYLVTYQDAIGRRRYVGYVLRVAYCALSRYQFLALLSIVYIFLVRAIGSSRLEVFVPLVWHSRLLYACTSIMLLINALLAVEAVVSLATMGSYAKYFHMLDLESKDSSRLLTELRAIFGIFIIALFSGAVAVYLTYVDFDGFKDNVEGALLPHEPRGLVVSLGLFFQSAYFTMTTLATVGFGDIVPTGLLGQLVTFLIELQGVSLFVFAVASLFSCVQETD